MRITLTLLLPLILVACGESETRRAAGTGSGILVVDHFIEVPRDPAPGYYPDGAMVQEVTGNAWSAAGVRAGDVIATVGGRAVWSAEEVDALLRKVAPLYVRVASSHLGAYGTRLLDIELER